LSIAKAMQDVLLSWGIDKEKIIIEDLAKTTLENAEYSLKKLEEEGYRRIILVNSALHMRRSVKCFKESKSKIITSPVNYIFEKESFEYFNFFA
jgi:uncharacterized SAM-binding protein YcdF (DUF218 family)